MKKLALLLILLTGCSSSDDSAPALTFSPGIYTGTFTPAGQATDQAALIVASDNTFALGNLDGSEAFTGTVAGATLTTTEGYTFTLTGDLTGTYTGAGITGTFTLTDAGLYERGASTAKLAGTWVDAVYTENTGTTTWTIDSAGTVSMTSVSGCAASGTLSTISAADNEYRATISVSACAPYDGNYSGLAFTDDEFFTDDALVLIIEDSSTGNFGYGRAILQ